jgi:hypothetical protein
MRRILKSWLTKSPTAVIMSCTRLWGSLRQSRRAKQEKERLRLPGLVSPAASFLSRVGAVAARETHNLQVVGSIPTPAPSFADSSRGIKLLGPRARRMENPLGVRSVSRWRVVAGEIPARRIREGSSLMNQSRRELRVGQAANKIETPLSRTPTAGGTSLLSVPTGRPFGGDHGRRALGIIRL